MSVATPTEKKAKPQAKAKDNSWRAESNRRNAKKSTGPRTAEGKDHSRYNALKHGLTAESTLLPGEDASAFRALRQEIVEGMQPRNVVEGILLEGIARCEWKSMRADRSASARLSSQLREESKKTNYDDADEVIALGQHLLTHPPFPLPVSSPNDKGYLGKAPLADVPGDPHHPARLVLKLEQTVRGCDWLLGRWAGLKLRLEIEGLWLMAEGYEMLRLMGKYVIEMVRDYEVEMVMLANVCLAADGMPENDRKLDEKTEPMSLLDIVASLNLSEDPHQSPADRLTAFCEPWARALAKRPLGRLMPKNAAEARRWLTVAMEAEVNRLTLIRAERLRFAQADRDEAPARLAFETGTEGDRLRRYDLSRDRVLIRTIGKFVEVRNASIAGTFNLLDYDLDELMEFDDPRDPQSCIHASPLADVSNSRSGQPDVNACVSDENVVEPRPDAARPANMPGKSDSPTADSEESCDDDQILRNEANAELVSGPLSVVRCEIETTHEPCTPNADMNAKDNQDLAAELARDEGGKLIWDEVARLALIRAENLRKLNEECQNEEREASAAARRARRRGRKNRKPVDRETRAPSRDQEIGCDDDQILRNEANVDSDDPRFDAAIAAILGTAATDDGKPTTSQAVEVRHVDDAADKGRRTTDKPTEDQRAGEATDSGQPAPAEAVDKATDVGQRATDQPVIVGGGLSNDQVRAIRYAQWNIKKQKERAEAAARALLLEGGSSLD